MLPAKGVLSPSRGPLRPAGGRAAGRPSLASASPSFARVTTPRTENHPRAEGPSEDEEDCDVHPRGALSRAEDAELFSLLHADDDAAAARERARSTALVSEPADNRSQGSHEVAAHVELEWHCGGPAELSEHQRAVLLRRLRDTAAQCVRPWHCAELKLRLVAAGDHIPPPAQQPAPPPAPLPRAATPPRKPCCTAPQCGGGGRRRCCTLLATMLLLGAVAGLIFAIVQLIRSTGGTRAGRPRPVVPAQPTPPPQPPTSPPPDSPLTPVPATARPVRPVATATPTPSATITPTLPCSTCCPACPTPPPCPVYPPYDEDCGETISSTCAVLLETESALLALMMLGAAVYVYQHHGHGAATDSGGRNNVTFVADGSSDPAFLSLAEGSTFDHNEGARHTGARSDTDRLHAAKKKPRRAGARGRHEKRRGSAPSPVLRAATDSFSVLPPAAESPGTPTCATGLMVTGPPAPEAESTGSTLIDLGGSVTESPSGSPNRVALPQARGVSPLQRTHTGSEHSIAPPRRKQTLRRTLPPHVRDSGLAAH